MPPASHRGQVVRMRIGAVDGQQPLHDGRHGGEIVHPVLGDQAQELAPVEPAHEHQMLARRQCHGGRGESGVVAQGNRHQLGVGRQVAHHRRHRRPVEPAVAAGLDELGTPGTPAGGHRLQRRRNRLGQRGIRDSTGIEVTWNRRHDAAWIRPADEQRALAQFEQMAVLRVRQPGGQRLRDGSQLPGGHHGLHPLNGVGQGDGDVVALAHTECRVGPGQPVGHRFQFAAGDGPSAVADRRRVGRLCGQPAHLRPDRRYRLSRLVLVHDSLRHQ